MRSPSRAAASPATWVLTLALVCVIDAAITRTGFLWGKTNLWVRQGGLERLYLWQAYESAQQIYYPRRAAAVRVAMLGNSRLWIPGRAAYVERELKRLAPDSDIRIDNLAFWGAKIGDLEIVSRHLPSARPTLVVLTLGYGDLAETPWSKLVNPTGELLDIGWRDGPLGPASGVERADRWLRTIWPLYRFRRFTKEMIRDRLFPFTTDTQFPDRFASERDYFNLALGERRAAKVDTAYQEWRQEKTFASFVAYLKLGATGFGLNEEVPDPASLTLDSPGLRVLDCLLSRLAAEKWATLVLLLPENPVLDQDSEGLYHKPGFSERSASLIAELAARYEIPVVDERRAMPAEAFVDLLHLFPDLSGFQAVLARDVLAALREHGVALAAGGAA